MKEMLCFHFFHTLSLNIYVFIISLIFFVLLLVCLVCMVVFWACMHAELMVLGFISLLLTFGQKYIAQVCIPIEAADTMLPCPYRGDDQEGGGGGGDHRRRLLWYERRYLAAGSDGPGCKEVILLYTNTCMYILIYCLIFSMSFGKKKKLFEYVL